MGNSFTPYNFIPLSEKAVPIPYASQEALPRHDIDFGLTGRIDYEIRNLTGISIGGDCAKTEKKVPIMERPFCTDGKGNMMIPGGTVRGYCRSHAEILSVSYPEIIGENHYLFRKFIDPCNTVKNEYKQKLNSEGNDYKIPNGVKAGFLYKENENGEDIYRIIPAKPFGKGGNTFFRVHEKDLRRAGVLSDNHYMYSEEIDKYHVNKGDKDALKKYNSMLLKRKNNNYTAYRGEKIRFDYTDRICKLGTGPLQGILLNSAWIEGKTHHYIVSDEKGTESFIVDKKEIIAYDNDYRRNCVQNKDIKNNREFYGLPEEYGLEKAKIFFYKREKSAAGRLIGFGPTPYFRVFYDHSVKDGLPMRQAQTSYDFVSALFGFTNNPVSYKGRLSFSNCGILNPDAETEQVQLYAGSPKGSAFQLYLEQEGRNVRSLKTYNAHNFRLRGYKFYWKRSEPVKDCAGAVKPNTSIAVVRPKDKLQRNNDFKGHIYFENLSEEELGLLLYTLQMDDDVKKAEKETYQIGNGKPYGYGKISICNVRVTQIMAADRYTSLELREKDITSLIPEFKHRYKAALKTQFGIDFDKEESIQEYIALANMEDADDYLNSHAYPYMTLAEYGAREPLPTASDILYKRPSGIESRCRRCIWVAQYHLSKNQEEKLKSQLGEELQVCKIEKWLEKSDIDELSSQYSVIAVPSTTKYDLLREAKSKFETVLIAKKGADNKDCGWQ